MGERTTATTLNSELASAELACLLELVKECPRTGRCLEIGTAAGGTLCQMMRQFTDLERPQFVVVDPMSYFTNQLETVRENLRRHGLNPAQVDLRVSTSADAFAHAAAAGETYDFMFIDGAHKIRYVTQDLRWTRLLKVGGRVCLHDYHAQHKGVHWPTHRLLRKYPNYRRERLAGSLLALCKPEASARPEISRLDELWAALVSPVLQWERSWNKRRRTFS